MKLTFIRDILLCFTAGICLISVISMVAVVRMKNESRPDSAINHSEPEPCGEECPDCYPTHYNPGDIDEAGKLVIFVHFGRYRVLESDYALVFRNDGDEVNPKPIFALSSRESGYEEFPSLEDFSKRAAKIHGPRIIDYYGTCAADPNWGIPKNVIAEFWETMERMEIELRQDRDGIMNAICTCPCSNSK